MHKSISIVATAIVVVSALVSTIVLSTDAAIVSKRVTNYQDKSSTTHILVLSDIAKVIAIFAEVAVYAQYTFCDQTNTTITSVEYLTPNQVDMAVRRALSGIDGIVAHNIYRLDILKSKWKKIKRGRVSKRLRRVDQKVKQYEVNILQLWDFVVLLESLSLTDLEQFYFTVAEFGISTDSSVGWEAQVTPLNSAYEKQRSALSRTEKKSTRISFITSFISFIVVLIAITLLAFTQLRLAAAEYKTREAEAKINAQSRLVRQQAHETRNRFGPAVAMMAAFLEANTYDEYRVLRQDMASALSVLKEVEKHQQTRLDIYKILKGNYELQYEIFDLSLLLNERVGAESTIARLLKPPGGLTPRNTPSHEKSLFSSNTNVRFCVGLPAAAYRFGTEAFDVKHVATALEESTQNEKHQNTPEIYVKTDVYILSHLLNNLLSNSRKHTYVGAITVYFLGTKHDKLIFQVHDDGVGIPLEIRDKLFAGADVATADLRGTGLGLSSCQIFARCANGYVRLVKSELQTSNNDHGCSIFEFAVKGEVLKNKSAYLHESKKDFIVREAVYDCTEQDGAESPPRLTSTDSAFSVHNHHSHCRTMLSMAQGMVTKSDYSDIESETNEAVHQEKATLHDDAQLGDTKVETIIPKSLQVVIIDDSGINRSCIRRSIYATAISLNIEDFDFFEYETCESAQSHLTQVAANPHVIVTIDQSLQSRGGVLTGTDLIKWLKESLQFKGILISSSGDAFIGQEHLALGAHLAWGKPLPSKKTVQNDLVACFTQEHQRRRLDAESENS